MNNRNLPRGVDHFDIQDLQKQITELMERMKRLEERIFSDGR